MQYLGLYMVAMSFVLLMIMVVFGKIYKKEKTNTVTFKKPLYYYVRKEKWYDNVYATVFVAALMAFFLYAFVFYINSLFRDVSEGLVQQVNATSSLVFSFFGVVISVIIFSVTLGPKEYYLIWTRKEVNRQFGIHIVFWGLCVCAVLTIICVSLLREKISIGLLLVVSLYDVCCLGILLGGLYGLIVIGILSLGKSEMELYSLNELYTKFWNNEPFKLINRTKEVIWVNLGYLLGNYLETKYVKKKVISNVTEIEYLREAEKGDRWEKNASVCLAILIMCCAILSIPCAVIIGDINTIWRTLRYSGMFLLFILWNKTEKIVGEYILLLIFDKNGFVIKNKKNKEQFVGEVPMISDRASRKYILSLCNIMALYCIICSSWKKKENKMIEKSLDEMVECLGKYEKDYGGYSKAMFYLPVFLCGYYYHINFPKQKFPEKVIDLFDSFQLTDKEKESYYITINSFISYGGRFRQTFKKGEEREEIKIEYFNDYIKHNGYSQLFKGLKRYSDEQNRKKGTKTKRIG